MASRPQRRMINVDLGPNLGHRLPQKVGQNIGPDCPGLSPCFGVSCCCHPDWQGLGHRARLGQNREHRPFASGEIDRLSGPERPQILDRLKHRGFVGGGGVVGAQDEIIGLPARRDGQADLAIGQIVDHRPFLGNPCGMM